jgi:phosphatidylserine/phosphatidylglycerophosphate/cardiolipin synthase-like enzyme
MCTAERAYQDSSDAAWYRARAMARLPRLSDEKTRSAVVELVADRRHYDEVVTAITDAKVSVWIATANLKDVHLEAPIGTRARARSRYVSITEHFESLVRNDVEIRILHGTTPSRPYRASLSKKRELRPPAFEMRQCPRVHLKMIAVDGRYLYVGSANFTGAGLGARSEGRRNFELGISTDDDVLLDAAQARFDRIWRGAECGSCRLRTECPKPIDLLVREGTESRPVSRSRKS